MDRPWQWYRSELPTFLQLGDTARQSWMNFVFSSNTGRQWTLKSMYLSKSCSAAQNPAKNPVARLFSFFLRAEWSPGLEIWSGVSYRTFQRSKKIFLAQNVFFWSKSCIFMVIPPWNPWNPFAEHGFQILVILASSGWDLSEIFRNPSNFGELYLLAEEKLEARTGTTAEVYP